MHNNQTLSAPIIHSLQVFSEQIGDPTQLIYQQYFNDCPGSADLMEHVDSYMRGRMLEEIFHLLMCPSPLEMDTYLAFEVKNHASYGVLPHMYTNLLTAVKKSVEKSLLNDWNTDLASAWDERIQQLLRLIERHATETV